MPDIQLRFHKDMLVLSSPIDALLAHQGIDASRDRQYFNLMEPDSIHDALSLEVAAGAQCVVTTTEDITQARLAHVRMDSDAEKLARAALSIANSVKPQHVLVEIGPCGLPLDPSSKSSLNENRSQYAGAARALGDGAFDAFFLNGFASIDDMRCALMGVKQVSDKPVFCSMLVGQALLQPTASSQLDGSQSESQEADAGFAFGDLEPVDNPAGTAGGSRLRKCLAPSLWPEAIDVMTDLEAAVVGFETVEPIGCALNYAKQAIERSDAPVLAQLRVTEAAAKTPGKNLVPLADIDEYTPDTMATAAVKLFGAGVQFLRATGLATPAFTGSLAATVADLDVHRM